MNATFGSTTNFPRPLIMVARGVEIEWSTRERIHGSGRDESWPLFFHVFLYSSETGHATNEGKRLYMRTRMLEHLDQPPKQVYNRGQPLNIRHA